MLRLHGACRARYTHSIALRPYQEDCVRECVGWLQQGTTRIGVSLPTGSGKTAVFISLLARLPSTDAKRNIVIVNNVELARQSAAQASRMFPHWSVEIEQGAKHTASGTADLTVATYQTLLNPERLAKFDPQKTRAIIIDEAHHAAAPSYRKLLSHFHADIRHPDAGHQSTVRPHRVPVFGFSATFSRHDGLALGSVFERIVYHRDVLQMIKDDWLCSVRLTSVRIKLGLNTVAFNKSGEFSSSSLARIMNTSAMNDLVVRTWLDCATGRKATLIFCVDVAHVHDLTNTFRRFGVDARCLTGRTALTSRKELVASFKAGEFPVLINCTILTEGADIPNVDCIMVARPTRSKNIFTQMIGRGMRLSPDTGKENCLIIDYVDTVNRVTSVMSVPTLFGLDPMKVNLENDSLEYLERKAKETTLLSTIPSVALAEPHSVVYQDHGGLHELSASLKTKEVNIRVLSPFAWVTCRNDLHVLQTFHSGRVKIIVDKEAEQPFLVRHYRYVFAAGKGKIEIFTSILSAVTLENALHGAETWLQGQSGSGWAQLKHTASWRKTAATSAQIKQIMELYAKSKSDVQTFLAVIPLKLAESHVPTAKEMEDRFRRMTKGQLFDAIIRLKHKADKHYTKVAEVAEKRSLKFQKLQEREHRRKANEIVSVGPLQTSIPL